MQNGKLELPGNLSIRLAAAADRAFIEQLYHASRDDLRLLQAERDFVEELISMQQSARSAAYEEQYPQACNFIVEYLSEPVGRVLVDFGQAQVHVVDIAFSPKGRGQGYGAAVMRALQQAARQIMVPMTLWVQRSKPGLRNFYAALGFQSAGGDTMNEQLIWIPDTLANQAARPC